MRKPDNSYATVYIIPHTTVCDVKPLQRSIPPAWRR